MKELAIFRHLVDAVMRHNDDTLAVLERLRQEIEQLRDEQM